MAMAEVEHGYSPYPASDSGPGVPLASLLGTIEGMDVIRDNIKNDNATDDLTGVEWFVFNGVPASKVYVSGNNFIGFGANTAHLKIFNRDGAVYYVYRQEGNLDNGHKFFKVRVEGYTRYNSTSSPYALKYEVFLFDSNAILLNVIQAPTAAGYTGTSALECGGAITSITMSAGKAGRTLLKPAGGNGTGWYAIPDFDPASEGILLTSGSAEINLDDTVPIHAAIASIFAKSITWSTADPAVATVDSAGVVTPVSAGTATVTAAADNGLSASINITIRNRRIQGISIVSMPDQLEYMAFEDFWPDGLSVKKVFTDGTEEMITDYTVDDSGYDPTTPGEHTIYVVYREFKVPFIVTVGEVGYLWVDGDEGITGMINAVTKTAEISGSGAVVLISMQNPEGMVHLVIHEGITSLGYRCCSNYPYTDESFPYTRDVKLPDSLADVGGQAFRGCKALERVDFGSGITRIGRGAFEGCSALTEIRFHRPPYTLDTSGAPWGAPQEVAILWDPGIWIAAPPDKQFYHIGEALDATGMSVNQIMEDGIAHDVTEYTISGFDSSTEGIKNVTVTVGSYAASFPVWVLGAQGDPAGVTIQSYPRVTYNLDEDFFDADGLSVALKMEDGSEVPSSIYAISGFDSSAEGMQMITISIGNYAVQFCVLVSTGALSTEEVGDPVSSDVLAIAPEDGTCMLINGTGRMKDFDGQYGIENSRAAHVTLNPGITYVGAYAFRGFSRLESLSLPEGLEEIGMGAFSIVERTHLPINEFVLPGTVAKIGQGAFYVFTENPSLDIVINNSQAEIFDSEDTISSIFRISGHAGSTAQAYAQKYGRTFSEIGRNVTGIIVSSLPYKIQYKDREEFEPDGIAVEVLFDNGETETLAENAYTITGFDHEPGDKMMVVTYVDKKSGDTFTAAFAVTVIFFDVYHIGTPNAGDVVASFDAATGILTISGTGEMKDFDLNDRIRVAEDDKANVVGIVVEDGVTSIGANAFEEYPAVKTVTLPSSVTTYGQSAFGNSSLEKAEGIVVGSIGKGAFSARYLKHIALAEGLTSIGDRAFESCSALQAVEVPSTVSVIGYGAFGKGYYGALGKTGRVLRIRNVGTEIYDSKDTIFDTYTIYAPQGSTAQAYAEKYGLDFILDGEIVAGIELQHLPDKTKYILSETDIRPSDHVKFFNIDLTGIAVNAVCESGRRYRIDHYASSPYSIESPVLGEYPITVTYGDHTSRFNITVAMTYTVTFMAQYYLPDGGKSIITLATQEVAPGGEAVPPELPEIEGNHFTMWDRGFTNITADTTITADYVLDLSYTVTFLAPDGSVLGTERVVSGKSATANGVNTAIPGYVFKGWAGSLDNIVSDVTIYGVYWPAAYTVTWKSWDGMVLQTDTGVGYGDYVQPPEAPVRPRYTFAGWDKDYTSITANVTITAQYTAGGVTGITLDCYALELLQGEKGTITVSLTTTGGDSAIIWTSDNAMIAKVENGDVTAVGSGNCKVTATVEGTGITASCQVTVVQLRALVETAEVKVGDVALASNFFERSGDMTITVSSDNSAVLAVNGEKLTALTPGVAIVTERSNTSGLAASCTFRVLDVDEADDDYKIAIKNNQRGRWNCVIQVGGAKIQGKTIAELKLHELMYPGQSYSIGGVVSSYVELKLKRPPVDMKGKNFTFQVGMEVNGKYMYAKFGRFYVEEAKKLDKYGNYRVVAYDCVNKTKRKYKTSLSYPASIKNVATETASQCGLSFTSGIKWPAMKVAKKIKGDTCRDVLGHIAVAMGGNIIASRSGKLEFRTIKSIKGRYVDAGGVSSYVDAYPKIYENRIYSIDKEEELAYIYPTIIWCNDYVYTDDVSNHNPTSSEYRGYSPLYAEVSDNNIGISWIGGADAIIQESEFTQIPLSVPFCPGNVSILGDPSIQVGDMLDLVETIDGELSHTPFAAMENIMTYDGGVKNDLVCYGESADVNNDKITIETVDEAPRNGSSNTLYVIPGEVNVN